MSEDNIFENEDGIGAPSISQSNNVSATDMYVDESQTGQQTSGNQYSQGNFSQSNAQNAYSQNSTQEFNNAYNSYQNTTSQQGYTVVEEPKKGLAIASMVLGIISMIAFCTCINIPLAIIGLILGIVYLAKKEAVKPGKGMAIAGVITSALAIICCVVYWVFCIKLASSFVNSVDMNQYNQYTDPAELYNELFKDIYEFQYQDNEVFQMPPFVDEVPKTDDTL